MTSLMTTLEMVCKANSHAELVAKSEQMEYIVRLYRYASLSDNANHGTVNAVTNATEYGEASCKILAAFRIYQRIKRL